MAIAVLTSTPVAASGGGSFLVTPNVGLMIWTLIAFGVTLLLLRKYAFPEIAKALDIRQKAIEDAIAHAEEQKAESDKLVAEYRERLSAARVQADEIVSKARRSAEQHEIDSHAKAREQREDILAQAARDVDAAAHRAEQELRRQVADLTVTATEKITRRSLDGDDQKRLVDEALGELDFSALGRNQG
jgi:F-type H+-transporting ATPase subunit b